MDNHNTITIFSTVGNYVGATRYAKKSSKIAEMVEKKVSMIKFATTEDNVTDIFTKTLGPQIFEKLRQQLVVTSIPVMVIHQEA